jgi:capsule polysaccharide export protein KpsE/RkpR
VKQGDRRALETPERAEFLIPAEIETLTPRKADSPALAISRLLWEQRRRLGRAILAGLVLTLVITLLMPNRYESTVALMPPDSSGSSGMAMIASLMGKAGLNSLGGGGLAGDLLGSKSSGAMFVGVLQSRTIADRIIDKFDLRKVYGVNTYLDTRKKLSSRSDISEDKKTGLISISVSDTSKERAAQMAQAYVDELDRLIAEVSTSSARRERIFLEQRLVTVNKTLNDDSQKLSEYSSKHTTLDIKEQGRAMVESAAVLQGQMIAAQSELSGLEQIYTPDNVRVRALRARIGELQNQLQKMGGTSAPLDASKTDDAALYPSIRQLPLLAVEFGELYRNVKIQETVYELLTQQYEMAKVEEAKEIPTVKVLDAPTIAEKKSWPPRFWLSLAGGFLGFVVMGCWIVGSELWSEVRAEDPHKEFVQQVWAETKPYLQDKKQLMLNRLHLSNGRGRNGNSSSPPE